MAIEKKEMHNRGWLISFTALVPCILKYISINVENFSNLVNIIWTALCNTETELILSSSKRVN